MKKYARYISLLLVLLGIFSQTVPAAEANQTFTQQELDQMLAPIALYPDPLLSQLLMAATYPLEIVEAARWSSAHPALNGDAAVRSAGARNWDPSVTSLLAYPQVLQTLNQNIEWTERLGDAFLGQQSQVMDTVQLLRQKAQDAGYLSSNSQVQVMQSDDYIAVAPSDPQVVYVPYYDPAVVYGSWWWPDYPPVYWSPWEGYGWESGFAWGVGIGVGTGLIIGSWDWHNHDVYIHDHRHPEERHTWEHDPDHRHGVPYRDVQLNRRFGRADPRSPSRTEFSGHEPAFNMRPGELDNRLRREPVQNTPVHEIHEKILQPTVRETHEKIPQPGTREIHESKAPRSVNKPAVEPRPHAFENVGRGADARNFSARGDASLSGRSPAHAAPLREPSKSDHH